MDISEPLITVVGFQKESLAVRGHFTIARAELPLTLAPVRECGERAQATRAKAPSVLSHIEPRHKDKVGLVTRCRLGEGSPMISSKPVSGQCDRRNAARIVRSGSK
jgi:hypothetical protein